MVSRSSRSLVRSLCIAIFLASPLAVSAQATPSLDCDFRNAAKASTIACIGTVSPSDSLQQVELVMRFGPSSSGSRRWRAKIVPTSGVVVSDSVEADASGTAHALWLRNKGADPVMLGITATDDATTVVRAVRLEPRTTTKIALSMTRAKGNRQSWYEKNQLRHPLVVELLRDSKPISDTAYCTRQKVSFSTVGQAGSILPDTVFAAMRNDVDSTKRIGCVASSNWTLNEGVGYRFVRTVLVPASGSEAAQPVLQFQANSRPLPKFFAGIAISNDRKYFAKKAAATRVVHVERTAADGSKESFDTTRVVSAAGVDTVKADWKFIPVAVINAVVWPKQGWLSLSGGVGLNDPTHDWFAGISVLRALPGFAGESLPLDIHLLTHWGRTTRLVNRNNCIQKIECRTDDVNGFRGWGAMVAIDAASVFADILKKLGSP